MTTRENLVVLASIGSLFLVGFATAAFGIALTSHPLPIYLLFVGLTIAVPQLYLAATDDDLPARTRIRFTVAVTALFALLFAGEVRLRPLLEGDLETLQHAAILAIGGGSVLALLCYEFADGYRSVPTEPAP